MLPMTLTNAPALMFGEGPFNQKKPDLAIGLLFIIRATSYSPTHLRMQYHRG